MRKYLLTLVLIVVSLLLVACNGDEDNVQTSYKINYYIKEEKVSLEPNTYNFIDEIELPTYELAGNVFLGWYSDKNFSGEPISKINRGSTGDKTFYGKILKTYKLTLDFNGGEAITYQESFHEEENVMLPNNINNNGFFFKGWYLDSDFNSEILTEIPFGTKEDITLYAKYLKYHKLTLNFNGGNPVDYLNQFHEEEAIDLPNEVINPGFVFAGWYTNLDFSGEPLTSVPKGSTLDLTLYAKWEPQTINLTLVFNGGDEVSYQEEIAYNEEYILPLNINKQYYEFAGWYSDRFFFGERIYKIEMFTTEDITLYANFDIAESLFLELDLPSQNEAITRSIHLSGELYHFYVEFDNQNEEIISNEGKLKRPYEEQEVTLTIRIVDYAIQKDLYKDFTYVVAGYLSLDDPIRAGYVLRDYFTIDEYYFDAHDIVYAAFAEPTLNGTFSLSDPYWGRVSSNVIEKAQERGIRVIMSLGGGHYSAWKYFLDTPENITAFAENVVEVINLFGFDGVDVDWEVPDVGLGQDKDFTALVKALNEKVKANNPHHIITAAITGGSSQPNRYDLTNSAKYLDYINLMTYQLSSNGGLYQNALHPRQGYHDSVNRVGLNPGNATVSDTIRIFNNLGVANNKLIVGIAFYGVKQSKLSGSWSHDGSVDYEEILNLIANPNYTRVFDNTSKVPYLINNEGTIFISYEDPDSITAKAQYVISNGIGGLMYWEYYQDYNNILLSTMNNNLPRS